MTPDPKEPTIQTLGDSLHAPNDMGSAPNEALDPNKPHEHFARTRRDSALVRGLRERFDEHAKNERIDERQIAVERTGRALSKAQAALLEQARKLSIAKRELRMAKFASSRVEELTQDLVWAAECFDAAERANAEAIATRGPKR